MLAPYMQWKCRAHRAAAQIPSRKSFRKRGADARSWTTAISAVFAAIYIDGSNSIRAENRDPLFD
jgi:hypothetical protein